jgi:hypothetical protein
MQNRPRTLFFALCVVLAGLAHAQKGAPASPPPHGPDTLLFINGEQLTGDLEKADSAGITFKSPMAGEITVQWANIKRLDTNKKFAVLSKNLKLTRKDALARAPQGEVTYTDQQIRVGTQTVPVANASLLVSSADFDKGLNAKESLLHGWAGAASAGVTVVRATQNTTTFTGGLALARSFPSVSWLPPHDRTLFAFNESYGNTTQAGATPLETNILHASLEQDEYVSPRIFVFGSSTFDHNFSQNLQLEAALGGGAGITAIKNEKQELDLKADVHYLEENFFSTPTAPAPQASISVFASSFSETYVRHLAKSILFHEFGSVSPAWTQLSAFSSHVDGSLVLPLFKGFGFNITASEDYLNNAPAGTKQNSTQFSTGITYAIKPK